MTLPTNIPNWVFGGIGMSTVIGYMFTQLRDKVGKGQFKEFKEANADAHAVMVKAQDKQDVKLDLILTTLNTIKTK